MRWMCEDKYVCSLECATVYNMTMSSFSGYTAYTAGVSLLAASIGVT